MMRPRIVWTAILLAMALGALGVTSCAGEKPAPDVDGPTGITTSPTVQPSAPTDIKDAASQVIAALATKDGAKLAALASSKGVRFSPYAYVDVEREVVLTPAQLKDFWADPKVYAWGFEDGSGAPIKLTPSQYCERFVYDRDFAKADSVSVNDDKASGNSINNADVAYQGATRVEYFIKQTDVYGEPDWAALRLVFEKDGEVWRLIGVIHDQWTI